MAERYDWRHRMATHAPVLFAAVQATDGAIAEFGCGYGSTPMLHRLAEEQGRRLISLETDAAWLDRFSTLGSELHELRLVTDWASELARADWDQPWSVVFVDQNPWEARAATVRRLRLSADLIVLHDCDYFPHTGLFGTEDAPLLGPHSIGARDYSDMFDSWLEFFPPEPWPFRSTGPPTLLASNRRDVTTLPVSFEAMLPRWWRIVRHARWLAPSWLKLRIANLISWGHS